MGDKKYIKLLDLSNQKIRQKYYTSESVSHPAKADIPTMIWILKKFVKDGDTVLDPMAGIFTTGIEGMRLFPNSLFIGIDLEQKFVNMSQASIKKVEAIAKKDMFMKIGRTVCVQGDSRKLSKILSELKLCPYCEKLLKKRQDERQSVFKKRIFCNSVCSNHYRSKIVDEINQKVKISRTEEEILIGLTIGDGCLFVRKERGQTPFLEISHSIKQKSYLIWKAHFLDFLQIPYSIKERTRERKGKLNKSLVLITRTNSKFYSVRKLLYRNRIKTLTPELLSKLTPFILALWFMDDGYADKRGYYMIGLSTDGFTHDEVNLLRNWFVKIYNIRPVTKKHGEKHTLYFRKKEMIKLSRLLKPYFHPSMLYKIGVEIDRKEKVDKIISSPPFQQAGTDTEKRMKKRLDRVFKGRSYVPTQKYPDVDNISNVKKYGKVDKIISSPPFGQAQSGGGIAKKGYDGPKHGPTDLVGKRSYMPENIGDKDNISNLPYGQTDKIISSPPFGGQVQHKTNYLGKQKKESGFEYSDNPENIGNMPHGKISKIISSPPYQEGIGHGGKRKKKAAERSEGIWAQGRDSYSKSKNNIGSLTGKTYLSEILKVYQQCYQILKIQGLMILITKDFIRNKKRIRLGEDTLKLCQMAGFKYLKTYHRKIEHPSFWRTLYHQKFPQVEKIDCEDILIFQKEK